MASNTDTIGKRDMLIHYHSSYGSIQLLHVTGGYGPMVAAAGRWFAGLHLHRSGWMTVQPLVYTNGAAFPN